MKIVWRRGTVTVRDVFEELRRRRRLAYTTVMTTMTILVSKGFLRRQLQDRAFVYRAARAESAVLSSMVREFVDRVFDGASRGLLLHLAKDARISPQDRAALRRLADEDSDKEEA